MRGVAGWRPGELAQWAAAKKSQAPDPGPAAGPFMFEISPTLGQQEGVGLGSIGPAPTGPLPTSSRVDIVRNRAELLRQRRPIRRHLKLVQVSAKSSLSS